MNFPYLSLRRAPLAWIACSILCAPAALGCASEYTVVSRGDMKATSGMNISARNLAPSAAEDERIADHLALAMATYEKQLSLLKERRNKVRARRRTYAQLALGTLAASAGATAATSILQADSGHADDGLKAAGVGALGSIFASSTFALLGYLQEEPEFVDDKIRFLENDYQMMLTRLRALHADEKSKEATRLAAGAIIEEFITHALAINVKG